MMSFLNPNKLAFPPHEFRIYADDRAQQWAVVDEEDYHWAIAWRWHINKEHPTRNGAKRYLCRNQSNARRHRPKLYLHVEIMRRRGIPMPTEAHNLVDHINGNELDCRRANLRWATHSMNNKNVKRRKRK